MEAAKGTAAREHECCAAEGVASMAQEGGLHIQRQILVVGQRPQRIRHGADEFSDQVWHHRRVRMQVPVEHIARVASAVVIS